jgi:hypothetical protein
MSILPASLKSPVLGWAVWPLLVISAGLAVFYAHALAGNIGVDFQIIRNDAQLFLVDSQQIYRGEVLDSMVGFIYPPPCIVPFVALSWLSVRAGYLLLVALLYLALAGGLVLLFGVVKRAAGLPPAARWVDWVTQFVIGNTARPMFEAAWAGQIDPIVLFLCIAYLALMQRGHLPWAGALLALGCWIKIYPALLLVHAMQHPDRRRCLVGFVAMAILVPLVVSPAVPVSLYVRYFTQALPILSGHAITNIYNQSAAAFFTRLDLPIQESLTAYHAHPIGAVARFGVSLAALAAIAVMLRLAERGPLSDVVLAASIIALVGPIAPLGWGHTYVYILPLLYITFIMARVARAWGTVAGVAAVLAVLAIPPHHHFPGLAFLPTALLDLVYSRYLLASSFLLVIAWLLYVTRLRSAADHGASGWAGELPASGVASR